MFVDYIRNDYRLWNLWKQKITVAKNMKFISNSRDMETEQKEMD